MDFIDNLNSSSSSNRNIIRVFDAIIEDISRERNTTLVTISYHDCSRCSRRTASVRLVVNQDTAILDERGRPIRAGELEPGMTVDASFSAAMTRSIPPQAQAFYIQVTGREEESETTTGRILDVNTRNNSILVLQNQNPSSTIQFQITNDTIIRDRFGRRISLNALNPGLRVRVEHATFMTASIPPQTTAFTIQVIR